MTRAGLGRIVSAVFMPVGAPPGTLGCQRNIDDCTCMTFRWVVLLAARQPRRFVTSLTISTL